jgi:hypothetical protein
MEKKKLVFKIAPDGTLTVEGKGFKGSVCLEKSERYLRGLGVVTHQEKNFEYFDVAGVEITAST